jgi:hypothetical protein
VGDVPPPIDEFQQARKDQLLNKATTTAEGRTVAPPVDGFRSENLWPATTGGQTDAVPPYPLNNGSTRY